MVESRNKAFAACLQFEGELEAYLEGEARPDIASHSQHCVPCAALLADLLSIRQTARNLPQEVPSPAVWARVRARLADEGAFAAPACAQFGDELEAYLEGEARPDIASHSQYCAPCASLLADLQSICQAARNLPQEEPSPTVWAKVRARLAGEGAFTVPACAQFAADLAAYMEGDARPSVLSHSRECAPCAALLADLQSIRETARNLPQEEPSRVVWANVRARLEADGALGQPVRGWRQILGGQLIPHAIPLGVLAALVFLGSALTLPPNPIERWGVDNVAVSSSLIQVASAIPTGEDGALAHLVSDLENSFRANEASMAPDLKATYEKSLVSLDGSIRECLDSLQHEPRNTLAHDYLVTAYTRKAEVLSSALEFNGR